MAPSRLHATPHASAPPGAPRPGFSLVELVLVTTILAIMAALVAPKLDPTRERADAALRLVRGTLQQAQRMAVQHQYDVIVSFDVPGRRLRVAEDSTNDRMLDSRERQRWIPLDAGVAFFTAATPIPGRLAGAAVEGPGLRTVAGLPSVVFRRSGAASGDVALYLEAVKGSFRQRRALSVTHSTGRAQGWRWQQNAWQETER